MAHEANTNIKYKESYRACIVRIVKQNKRIHITDVMYGKECDVQLKKQVMEKMKEWNIEEEVGIQQMDDEQDFTKCVDSLIESEYIQRSVRNSGMIEYV